MAPRLSQENILIVLTLVLGGWGLGTEAPAQFRSTETSTRTDSVQSVAPTPLSGNRSPDREARAPNALRPTMPPPSNSRRSDLVLSRGQKLFWGTMGMVLHSFCDSGWENENPTKPHRFLTSGERACVECERVEERATDALSEGLFRSDS